MGDTLKDDEVQVGSTKIGGSTLIKFNLKTLGTIFGLLYLALGYLYFDLRSDLADSVEISNDEKTEFLRDVEDDWDSKLDQIQEITTMIRLEQANMKGDIKVILDRNQRNTNITPTDNSIDPVMPPSD
jgi:hypothetical protein